MVVHQPVLLKEFFDNLPENLEYFFDGTLWHWGHTKYMLSQLREKEKSKYETVNVFGVDKDEKMLEKAKSRLNKNKNKISYIKGSYGDIGQILKDQGVDKVDGMLLDLGVNMEHFKDAERGFSIKNDGPLDMRFDRNQDYTAEDYIQKTKKRDMKKDLEKYGDFPDSIAKRIAKTIKREYRKWNITSTLDLVDQLKDEGIYYKKIPVVFQCIRIKVNNELKALEEFLDEFYKYLGKWGVCMIITYHTIEARISKYGFQQIEENHDEFKTGQVLKPDYKEIQDNKAARSAQLRILRHTG